MGYSPFYFTDKDGVITTKYFCSFFMNDEEEKRVLISGDKGAITDRYDSHTYYHSTVLGWLSNTIHFSTISNPSAHCKNLMKILGYVRTSEGGWQTMSDYDKALVQNKKPTEEPKTKAVESEDNVVTVNFKKDE